MKFLRHLPKEKKQQLLLIAILTAIAGVALYIFWIGEQRKRLKACKDKIAKLEPQILDRERKERAEALNESFRQQLAAFVRTQQQTMVTGDLFSWVVREITLFAERRPVQMVNIRPGQRQPHPTASSYEMYTAQVELRGTYDDLGRFLAALETHFPTAQIRSLDLMPGEGHAGTRRAATLELAFLIWPENATTWISPQPTEEPKKKS